MRGKYAEYELSTVRASMFLLFFRLLMYDFLSPFFSPSFLISVRLMIPPTFPRLSPSILPGLVRAES